MSIIVVGSTALDSIKTPYGENPRLLGGSASHAAVAASFFCPVKLVGIVGSDFPRRYMDLYRRHGIDLRCLEMAEGKTFHWCGEYEVNMNNRRTLATELGVLEKFAPTLPPSHQNTPFVLLANVAPSLQRHVLDQVRQPRFVVADTMDLWVKTALDDLLRLLRRVDAFVLNDSEARLLTKQDNIISAARHIHRLGPRYVVVKKGEHGAVLSTPSGFFVSPAFPLEKVVDPTGAGDSFVGALVGYLASRPGSIERHLRRAMIYGSVVASFCCQGFGLTATVKATRAAIERRAKVLMAMARV
jgi:sugar/nucleoside kinase (ribokinase family)